MRPNTLAEAYERIAAGQPLAKALSEFLDAYYGLADGAQRGASLADEPQLTGDVRLDALAGAAAEYLAKAYRAQVPAWAGRPVRYLDQPWFTFEDARPGMIEYLVHSSPAEFRSRNIFTESRPFRRASQARQGAAAR
jgi:hypothetical protein